MAVPKRKTSRSNTRSRRANWKATRDHSHHVPPVLLPPSSRTSRARPAAPTRDATTAWRSAPSTRADPVTAREQPYIPRVYSAVAAARRFSGSPTCSRWSARTIDEPLLLRALTHRSYAYENGGLPNNERLEFLGDSVLGLVVTDSLYAAHPDLAEGQLAKLRAAVVNMRALADVARTLGLGDYVLLGRGEESTGGRDKASILADTIEAVIGTVFLSAGMTGRHDLRPPPSRPLMEATADPGRRARLEDEPAGAGRRALARRRREYRVDRGGARPREDVPRRVASVERCWARAPDAARRKRSSWPPRPGRACRARDVQEVRSARVDRGTPTSTR